MRAYLWYIFSLSVLRNVRGDDRIYIGSANEMYPLLKALYSDKKKDVETEVMNEGMRGRVLLSADNVTQGGWVNWWISANPLNRKNCAENRTFRYKNIAIFAVTEFFPLRTAVRSSRERQVTFTLEISRFENLNSSPVNLVDFLVISISYWHSSGIFSFNVSCADSRIFLFMRIWRILVSLCKKVRWFFAKIPFFLQKILFLYLFIYKYIRMGISLLQTCNESFKA